MESFVATYTNARGQERQLQLRAASMVEARRNLRRRGIRPINVEPVTEAAAAAGRPAAAAAP
ncbi:MAG: type II secretion system F family protein, partial [Cyanobacteriota bacterium]